jgi:hypothetical protein
MTWVRRVDVVRVLLAAGSVDERSADLFFAERVAQLDCAVLSARELFDELERQLLGERVAVMRVLQKAPIGVVLASVHVVSAVRSVHDTCLDNAREIVGTNRELPSLVIGLRAVVLLGFLACSREPSAGPILLPPVLVSLARQPMHALPAHPALDVTVHGPAKTPYRVGLLGSPPERVDIAVRNTTDEPHDISKVRVVFQPRRDGVPMACPELDDVPLREAHWIRPAETVVFERELCSLPLLGRYEVDVMLGFGARDALVNAGAFAVDVVGDHRHVPETIAGHPGLFVAMGGDVAGLRFAAAEWRSGTYHVVLRFTNAGRDRIDLGGAQVFFRVTKDSKTWPCSSAHEVTLPPALEPGHEVTANVPVTCIIDIKGRYTVDASVTLAGEEHETPLGELGIEVTSDPLLYLPQLPPW